MNGVPSAVQFDEVHYRYPNSPAMALQDVSFQLIEGNYTLVAGASGSGKSTLLRCLNGLVPHFTGGFFGGRVLVCGEDTRYRPTRALARVAGIVFQDSDALTATGRVDDEIAFGMEQLAVPVNVMKRRLEELLDSVGISQLRSRRLATLSGGERQRVSIACALALNPSVLVLDEPTSQLDPTGAEEVISTIRLANCELDTTVLVSEHRLERLLGEIDRFMTIENGQVDLGEPRQMLAKMELGQLPPQNRLFRALGLSDVPLTIKEGRRLLANAQIDLSEPATDLPRPDRQPAVLFDRVSIDRDEVAVTRSASFEIRPGEVVALMGRNGSGKSTLLQSVTGLLPVRSGSVLVNGEDVATKSTQELSRTVGYLPQRARSLLFHEKVREELSSSGGPSIERIAVEFGIQDLLDYHPFDLSVGEQERLALAVTFAGDRPVLLLDEPTRGMDSFHKQQLVRSIQSRSQAGCAVLLATHDVELVAEVASHIVVLGDREIVAEGPPRQMLSDSITLSPQMTRLFGHGYLTIDDVVGSRSVSGTVG